jgi:hypothetical protein
MGVGRMPANSGQAAKQLAKTALEASLPPPREISNRTAVGG